MSRAAALVLAGGASRRMPGVSKLARAWSDTTVLGAVVRAARDAGLAPVVVVERDSPLDSNAEEAPEAADAADAAQAAEAAGAADAADRRVGVAPGGGRADSLAAGLRVLEPGPVVVLLGDEPGVSPEVVTRLVDECERKGADAGRVEYADRPGHPVWLGPAARAAVAGLGGEPNVWDVLRGAGLRLASLSVPGPAPIDVDSPADLSRARRRARRR